MSKIAKIALINYEVDLVKRALEAYVSNEAAKDEYALKSAEIIAKKIDRSVEKWQKQRALSA